MSCMKLTKQKTQMNYKKHITIDICEDNNFVCFLTLRFIEMVTFVRKLNELKLIWCGLLILKWPLKGFLRYAQNEILYFARLYKNEWRGNNCKKKLL
jgi:hypothetical protein